jgi:hypothetical protein
MTKHKRIAKVPIIKIMLRDGIYHCAICCKGVHVQGTGQTGYSVCDCDLEKIALYVEYDRGAQRAERPERPERAYSYAKEYAYECLSCKAINKVY